MTHELLHRYAKDKDSNLVSIEDAEKGNEYFCPGCGRNFILRKSGNTGKGSRRPHFAHNNFDESISKCEPDRYLHETFKIELFDLLEESIKSNSPLNVTWKCKYCQEQHQGNILQGINNVRVEHDMKVCRPDIALLDKNEIVRIVIEVVVTHSPEESTIQHYENNKITLIQIKLLSFDDLDNVENRIRNSSDINFCQKWSVVQKPPIPQLHRYPRSFQRGARIDRLLSKKTRWPVPKRRKGKK